MSISKMKQSKKFISFFYYMVFALVVFTKNFFRLTSELEHLQNLFWALCYILLFLLFVFELIYQFLYSSQTNKKNFLSFKEVVPVFVGAAFCVSAFLGNPNREWFVMGFIAILSWVACQETLIAEALCIHSFILFSSPIFLYVGIVPDVSKPVNGLANHSLGLSHPNALGFMAFFLILLIWVYAAEHSSLDKSFKFLSILTGVSVLFLSIVYCISLCRTAILCAIFFFFLAWFHFFIDKKPNYIVIRNRYYKYFVFIPIVCVLITFLFGAIFKSIDYGSTFTGRFVEIFNVLRSCGLTLFGAPTETYWIDNAYACFLFRGGLILLIVYVIFLTLSYHKVIKTKSWIYLIFFLVIQLYAFMESAQLIWTAMTLQFTYLFTKVCNKRTNNFT